MERELNCLRCQSIMIEGNVLDGRFLVPTVWVDGAPKMGWLGPKVNPKEVRKLKSFRCPACGYVEVNAGSDNA